MRNIKTQSNAKGYRDLNVTPHTTRETMNKRLPPRTAEHIRHAHTLKGIREIPRVGWQEWEPVVAETLRSLERQRFDKANRYYNALQRISVLLDAVRRRSEEVEDTAHELQQTSGHLQTLMDAMTDILITTTPDGIITDVNRATTQLTGYSRQALVDGPFFTLFSDQQKARKGFEHVLEQKQIINYELVLVTHDKREIPVSYNANVLQDAEGEVVGVLFNARNITELKKAEAALNVQTEELQRSNAELEQFAYVASHDLQEPLRKIQTFADVLKSSLSPEAIEEEERDYLDRMLDAAGRMRSLIDDLLMFSRITTWAQGFEQVNLEEVVDEVLSDLEISIEQTGAQIEIHNLPTIEAEPTQMRQLFQNLISNALKFHNEGQKPVIEISGKILKNSDALPIETVPYGNLCQISIKDNGIGFDEKYLDRIFVVFQRLYGRNEYAGTGIGLAVCRKIVDRHSGHITAKSKPDKGATFIVTLPIRQPKREEQE